MARAHKVLKSFSLKSYQKKQMLWRDMRGRTKKIHKELQDLDPIGSPHLEEKVIGRNAGLDLLSLFPQKDARIMEGMEEGG
jgi:hypothetical protein